ncbi:HupE/UreJ family protein [Oryzicola mucosus]|uniref:HupE/UreJ family protein n=1 Tax=Oryzicola mucosus TaxID=2767425 RepID=A0A8J6PUA6_9HYPH|nr:HupE/UreJ family protein [Oryzicola mucosus]MBD0413867.1 HupE/UreJ family protein [Oryzicola mucosus]
MKRSLLALGLTTLPSAAFAHVGGGEASGFAHGFMHPIGGVDHILAMVAVGVFAYVLGGRALYLVPASFVGMMIVGFLLGTSGVDLPLVELGIGLSSVVIGGAAAWGRSVPTVVAMALVGVFAVFHGHAHGAEMPGNASGFLYAAGFILATASLHLAGIAASIGAAALVGKYARPVARAVGALFAVGGIGVLAGWL